uniref:Uncharacterized protein n=1 Tax=Vespula pensylvanica TaxID=30213 RepID=A0A834PCT3_VESPE|nr:hypothetical protein H0235_003848 [Vespula pensylvanica]
MVYHLRRANCFQLSSDKVNSGATFSLVTTLVTQRDGGGGGGNGGGGNGGGGRTADGRRSLRKLRFAVRTTALSDL